MVWSRQEEEQLFIVYLYFRKDIVKGEYPAEQDFNLFAQKSELSYLVHPFGSNLMRLKNIAACDKLVKHRMVLSNVASQTRELAKKYFNAKNGDTKSMALEKFTPWSLDEEKQLFIVYIAFRMQIILGDYPSEKEFNNVVSSMRLTKIIHPFNSVLMRLKNIASCDNLVKHKRVLSNVATQTKKLAKLYFV